MAIQTTRRLVTAGSLALRADAGTVTVEGYASTFNQPYDMGWYTEQIAPGAFTRTLGINPDVRFLINHDGLPLARTASGTLDLAQDSTGLHVRSVLDASDPDVQRIVPKMERGDLNEMSFAFGIVDQDWSPDYAQRTIKEVSLAGGDVSIVTYPANPNAGIALRMRRLAEEDPTQLRNIYAGIMEGRVGKTLSADTTNRLTALLESIAAADVQIDGALVDLSDLLGVTNPNDAQDAASKDGEEDEDDQPVPTAQDGRGRPVRDIANLIALARR